MAGKVCVKTAPWLRIPESQIPLGIPGLPEVVLWPPEAKVHRTVSPGRIVTVEGIKKNPPLPTVTSTVALIATVGYKAASVAILSTHKAVRCKEVFMVLVALPEIRFLKFVVNRSPRAITER